MAYEERYCAFVDILAFSDLIAEVRHKPEKFEIVRDILKKIRNPHDPDVFGIGDSDWKAQSISDAVAFSTKPTMEGLNVMGAKIRDLSIALLSQGFFIRGALCKGLLHQDNDMVFGEALIRAHSLESTVANYPRVMITRDIVEDAKNSGRWTEMSEHILLAEDGPHYLHVLWKIGMVLQEYTDHPTHRHMKAYIDYHYEIQKKIEEKFAASVDTPRHYEKVKWFVKYWNQTVDPVASKFIMHINGPGLPYYFNTPPDNRIPPY